jgi:hypothetical protein
MDFYLIIDQITKARLYNYEKNDVDALPAAGNRAGCHASVRLRNQRGKQAVC